MKNSLITAQMFWIFGLTVALHDLTYTQYFFNLEQKALEEDLHRLEVETLAGESFPGDISHDKWMQHIYNLSSIATSLITGLKPSLTAEEVGEVGKSMGWVKSTPAHAHYQNDQWNFHFNWRYHVSDPIMMHMELPLEANWRKLTNRVLLWKTRQVNWHSLVPPRARPWSTGIALAKQQMFADIQHYLKRRFDELLKRSLQASGDMAWRVVVINAALVGEQLLQDGQPDVDVGEASRLVQSLGWKLTTINANDNSKVWNHKFVNLGIKTPPWMQKLKPNTQINKLIDILSEWVKLNNDVLEWKLQLLE